jgi:hypothetical protein
MPLTHVRARVTTTHHISAYGGFQFPPDFMNEVAAAIQSGRIPMLFHHNTTRPVHPKNVRAGTEILKDGHRAVWVEFDVDKDLWAGYEDECQAAGAPGGFSVSVTAPISGSPSDMAVAGDASHFDEETLVRAAADLRRLGDVRPEWLFQFGIVPEPRVIFDLLVNVVITLGPNIVASAIYDAARHFLRPRLGRTSFDLVLRESPRGRRRLKVKLAVDDPRALKEAMETLPTILSEAAGKTFSYDIDTRSYREIHPRGGEDGLPPMFG